MKFKINKIKEMMIVEKIFYHVVTEKPMYPDQEITFDHHHSGVYARVYSLKEEVE